MSYFLFNVAGFLLCCDALVARGVIFARFAGVACASLVAGLFLYPALTGVSVVAGPLGLPSSSSPVS